MNLNVEITTDVKLMQQVASAVLKGFIESSRYTFSKREAYAQFGKAKIDALIDNNLIKDTNKFDAKAQFLLSDIITALEVWDNMQGDTRFKKQKSKQK